MTINKLDCFIEPVNPLVTKGALLYLPIWQVMCALILFRELRDESRSRLCLAQTRSAIHICGKPLLSFLFATPVSFGRFEGCGIPFHNIHKGLEFVRMIIPGLSEPPVRTLRATIPENESHIFR